MSYVITFTSLKGGVGKTTMSLMTAKYLAKRAQSQVVVIDLDAQMGLTSIVIEKPPSTIPGNVYEVCQEYIDFLQDVPEGVDMTDLVKRSTVTNQGRTIKTKVLIDNRPVETETHLRTIAPRINIIPGDRKVGTWGKNEIPVDILRRILDQRPFTPETIVIIDTGPNPVESAIGMYAADAVFIPLMLSPQAGKPTAQAIYNAIKATQINPDISMGGLVPISPMKTNWEKMRMEGIQTYVDKLSRDGKIPAHPQMPIQMNIVNGKWIEGDIPDAFIPTLESIYQRIHGQRVEKIAREAEERELEELLSV